MFDESMVMSRYNVVDSLVPSVNLGVIVSVLVSSEVNRSDIDLLSPIGAKQQSFLYIYLKSDTNVQLSTRLYDNKDDFN
jgi:hypothetical protein